MKSTIQLHQNIILKDVYNHSAIEKALIKEVSACNENISITNQDEDMNFIGYISSSTETQADRENVPVQIEPYHLNLIQPDRDKRPEVGLQPFHFTYLKQMRSAFLSYASVSYLFWQNAPL